MNKTFIDINEEIGKSTNSHGIFYFGFIVGVAVCYIVLKFI